MVKESDKYLKINNVKDFWDNLSDKENLISFYEPKNRTFCRCGAVHKKTVYSCPVCGKGGTHYSYGYGTTRNSLSVPRIESTPNGFSIVADVYDIVPNVKTFEFDISKSKVVIAEKDSDGLTFFRSSGYSSYASIISQISELKNLDFEDLKKIDSSYFTNFENFDTKTFFQTESLHGHRYYYRNDDTEIFDNDAYVYLLFCVFVKNLDWLKTDKNMHEAFIGAEIGDILDGKYAHMSFAKILKDMQIPNELKKYVDCPWFYSNNYRGTPATCRIEWRHLSNDYKQLILNAVEHYHFTISVAAQLSDNLINGISDGTIDSHMTPAFEKYCKDNLISYQGSTVSKYISDCEELRARKLKVTQDNLRELPLIKNREKFKEMGYDDGRVDVFLESFFDNPIKSSYYLKSKKALTKKELDTFLDTQI